MDETTTTPLQHVGLLVIGREDIRPAGPTWDELHVRLETHQETNVTARIVADDETVQRLGMFCQWVCLN